MWESNEVDETLIVDLFYNGVPHRQRVQLPVKFRNNENVLQGREFNDRYMLQFEPLRKRLDQFITTPHAPIRYFKWYITEKKPLGPIDWRKIRSTDLPKPIDYEYLGHFPRLKKKYVAIDMSEKPYPAMLGCSLCLNEAVYLDNESNSLFCSITCYREGVVSK